MEHREIFSGIVWAMGNPNPTTRRSLDEIITENALVWVRRRVAIGKLRGESYGLSDLAKDMLPHIGPDPEEPSRGAIDRIRHVITGYLGLNKKSKTVWRIDYLEGFCAAMGLPVREILVPLPALSEADERILRELTAHARWLAPGELVDENSD